ncbi:MAG: extracellular solute-binding protein [Candidatus Marinimicrobia bacterium]|nr:extracellular solute-binding protein [Candidatus Neomarinimicrobiota bacterium]
MKLYQRYNLIPILLIIGFFNFLVSVQSCEKKANKKQKKSEIIELTYWCAAIQQEIDLAKSQVKEWNATHDSVKVKLQPLPESKSSEEVLLAAIAGGTTPDVCSNMWPGAMDDYVSAGGLVCLNEYPFLYDYIKKRVPPDILENLKASDGKLYQVPWKTNPLMMMYNVNMFENSGVDSLPRTYSDHMRVGEKITRDTDGDGRIDQWLGYRDTNPIWWQRLFDFYPCYIAASSGHTLVRNSEIDLNNQPTRQVLNFFRRLYVEGYYPITTFKGDAFLEEKIATQITGPWNVTHVRKFKPEGFKFDVMPIPVPDDHKGPVYTYGDYKNISIFSNTKYPEEACRFAKFLISKRNDLKLLEMTNQIPIRANIIKDDMFSDYLESHPLITKFIKQSRHTRGVDGIPDLKEIFDAISQEYEACSIYNKRSVDEAAANMEKQANVIIKWNRSR